MATLRLRNRRRKTTFIERLKYQFSARKLKKRGQKLMLLIWILLSISAVLSNEAVLFSRAADRPYDPRLLPGGIASLSAIILGAVWFKQARFAIANVLMLSAVFDVLGLIGTLFVDPPILQWAMWAALAAFKILIVYSMRKQLLQDREYWAEFDSSVKIHPQNVTYPEQPKGDG